MGSKNKGSKGGVTVIDKFMGEVREGGVELLEEMHANLIREREQFLESDNSHYLIGQVRQNNNEFTADEIKGLVDATFKCACHDSLDAWYPNQYALSLAFLPSDDVPMQVGYFLNNFELGLRLSARRAARHLAGNAGIVEAKRFAARLEEAGSCGNLNSADYREIVAHVVSHPLRADAMAWYEKGSGKKMSHGNDADNGKPKESNPPETSSTESLEAKGKQDMLADIEFWKGIIRKNGRDVVIGDLVRGALCTWLGSDISHRLYIKAVNESAVRKLLGTYTDGELGEWFSLMTSIVMAQVFTQVGMQWKQYGKDEPVLLVEYPPLSELRTHFH